MKPELNICEAPYNADPTGTRDCTESILRALDDVTMITRVAFRQGLAEVEALPAEGKHYHQDGFENHRVNGEVRCICCARLPFVPVVYFPAGTYLVSDTLCYRHKDLVNTYGSDMNQQIRIRGAGAGKTVIRLRDNAPGFGEGGRKPVISFMPGEKSNVSMSNYCEDLAIHCGSGNPGAVGLDFFANNSGAVRNIKVVSGDGRGFAGVQLGHGNYSGILIKHVEIEGFDHGLHVDSTLFTMFAHAEDITVRRQRVAGVTVGGISLSLRKIRTENVPVAVQCTHPAGLTVLVDSTLSGNGPVAIDRQSGALYVSNVDIAGFKDAGHIDEHVYPGEVKMATGRAPMKRLPIEDAPVYQHAGERTGVRCFGAVGNGVNDDSLAFQLALDSGAPGICVEPGRYLLNGPVLIPSHVKHIDFAFCDLVAGIDLKRSQQEGFVIAGTEGDSPLFVERLFAFEQWSGEHCTFTHASQRTVCFKDMHTQMLKFYRNTVPGGKVFFDNVACTVDWPGKRDHGRCAVSLKGQKVWARQLNPERGEPMILNDGGDLVLLGYKSEGAGVVVRTINGGRTEILGGVINIGRTGEVAFVAEDSSQRISTASQGWLQGAYHKCAICEIRDGRESCILSSTLPSRCFPASRGPQYFIPLYNGIG